MTHKSNISIIGAGSWGTALSVILAQRGHSVRLWGYEEEVVESIKRQRENGLFMPGIRLPDDILATTDIAEVLHNTRFVVSAMPSHFCRSLYEKMLLHLDPGMIFVSATKGLDTERLMRMSEVIRSVVLKRFEPHITVISGPSFALEVVRSDPTAIVVASQIRDDGLAVQEAFSSRTLRLYTSNDVIGVELGGAVKNVIAIAAGVIEGLGLGHNPKAALITRGLAEISRLACACGAQRETLAGLAGVGDLVLTCTGELSRNRSLGVELGRGRWLAEILSSVHTVAEGVKTASAAVELARLHSVEMPITRQVHRILEGDISPQEAIRELMERTLKDE